MATNKKAEKEKIAVWKRESGWEKLSREDTRQMDAYARDYIDFLSHAKTERLAHDIALGLAKKAGFSALQSSMFL